MNLYLGVCIKYYGYLKKIFVETAFSMDQFEHFELILSHSSNNVILGSKSSFKNHFSISYQKVKKLLIFEIKSP